MIRVVLVGIVAFVVGLAERFRLEPHDPTGHPRGETAGADSTSP
jgi:hypothetical protein